MPKTILVPLPIYQLKITLKSSKPPIWRRVETPATITLGELHVIIQLAMDWFDMHLHQFTVNGMYYGIPEWDEMEETLSEERLKLNQALTAPKQKLEYEYDFGDSWVHTVLLEKVLELEPGVTYPRCTAGKRACPPEDCGGIWGYEGLLAILADPEDEEHEEMLEWLGGDFDPEKFDLAEVNTRLKTIKVKTRTRKAI